MLVFLLLGILFLISRIELISHTFRLKHLRDHAGWAMGIMFFFTGFMHFIKPEPFVLMVPSYIPWPDEMVALSGVAELIIGLGLMIARYRRIAAYAAIALLIAVLPANIYAAQSGVEIPDYPSESWYRWFRVALQPLLIAWALMIAQKKDRPSLLNPPVHSSR